MKRRSKKNFFFYINLDTIMNSLGKLNRTLNIRNTKIGLYFIFLFFTFLFLSVYCIFRTRIRNQCDVTGYSHTVT